MISRTTKYMALLVILMLVFLLCMAISAQEDEIPDDSQVNLVSAVELSAVHADINVEGAPIISPDASTLIWNEQRGHAVCLYTFANETTECSPYPEDLTGIINMAWSPDSNYVAFTENFPRNFHESDIWIYSIENGRFHNITNDDVWRGDFIKAGGEDATIDLHPLWNPENGDLYFFRTVRGEDTSTNTIQRFAADELLSGDMPEMVLDLAQYIETPYTVYSYDDYDNFPSAVISADGKQLAILIRPHDPEVAQWGVWLSDLGSGTLEQIITLGDMKNPVFHIEGSMEDALLTPNGIAWIANDGLIVTITDPTRAAVMPNNVLYYDIETEALSILVDFSDIEDPSQYLIADNDGMAPIAYEPRIVAISPNSNAIYYTGNPRYSQDVSIMALPPSEDGDMPTRIQFFDEGDDVSTYPYMRPSVGANDEHILMIMLGWMFTFERTE
jgi:hypothetical protein